MTQKRRKADSGKAIGETTALRWEPTHVTKPNPRVVPLHRSSLLTTLIVSLLRCVKVDTLGTLCEEDLDRAYYPFEQFNLNYHAKFLYSLFNTFILDSFPQTL